MENNVNTIYVFQFGLERGCKIKELNRYETIEKCETRRRDLAAKNLNTPSVAINSQYLRMEVPVPIHVVCLCVRPTGKKYEMNTL